MYYSNRNALSAFGQQQQQGNTGYRPMRQSPALQTPLPDFKPPVGARGQDIMIIWDFQNVRTPAELEPVDVIRFLYNTFIMQPGPRRCAGAFCTFTDNTKKAVGEKRFNQFCSNGVLNFMMINSPGGPRKADDSDHPLKEMMMNFTVDCVRGNKDGVLLLITADADFVRPAIWCKQQGCISLELLYYGPIASKEIKQLEAGWKMEWRDFLDCCSGMRRAWTFPYPQDVAAGLVPASSSSNDNTGFHSSSPLLGYSSDRDDHRQKQQQRQQQQQQHAIAGFLPAPQQRLRLQDSSSTTGSTTVPPPAGAVQVSTARVHQAAQQLLQNPAALHQVVEQYKQSMQTTAVLQQVLQGVAFAANTSAPAAGSTAPAMNAAAFGSTGRSGFIPVPQSKQGNARNSGSSSANGSYSTTPVKGTPPVQLYTSSRPSSACSVHNKSPVGCAAESSSNNSNGAYTWQQLEQQQQQQGDGSTAAAATTTAVRGGAGFWDAAGGGSSSRSRSPPPPEWWDSSNAGKDLKSVIPKAAASTQHPRVSGTGSAPEAVGSKSWTAKTLKFKPEGWSEEEQEEGFWDTPVAEPQGARSTSGSRSQTPSKLFSNALNELNSGSSSSSNAYPEQQQQAFAFGTGTAAPSATTAAAGLPPTPSSMLLKRAGSNVGISTGSTTAAVGSTVGLSSTGKGSAGALAALLSGAAAAAAGRNSSSGTDSPARQHSLHHHTGGNSGSSSGFQQQQQQQQSMNGEQLRHRSPSPALPTGRQQQQDAAAYERHQQHHEMAILQQQRQQQQLAKEATPAATGNGSSSNREDVITCNASSSSSHEIDRETKLVLMQQRLLAKEAAAAAAKEASAAAVDGTAAIAVASAEDAFAGISPAAAAAVSTGVPSRPKHAAGPGLLAAARILSRAAAEAVASARDSTAAEAAAGAAGLNQGFASAAIAESAQDAKDSIDSSSSGAAGGGVVILQAPPVPQWFKPQQQQDGMESSSESTSAFVPVDLAQGFGSAADASAEQILQLIPQEQQQGQQQQQQQQEELFMIDEETGELIIMKPKVSTAPAAAAAPAAAPLAVVAAESMTLQPPQQPPLLQQQQPQVQGMETDGNKQAMCGSNSAVIPPAAATAALSDTATKTVEGNHAPVLSFHGNEVTGCALSFGSTLAGDEEVAAAAAAVDTAVDALETKDEQLLHVGLSICNGAESQPSGPYSQSQQSDHLVQLQLSVAEQQQESRNNCSMTAAPAAPVDSSSSETHGSVDEPPRSDAAVAHSQLLPCSCTPPARQVSRPTDGGTEVHSTNDDIAVLPAQAIDPQVSEAAAIAAAALAATAEELLTELPTAAAVDQSGFQSDTDAAVPSSPEPPSPGSYTALSPVETDSSVHRNSDGEGSGLEGNGLGFGPAAGPYLNDRCVDQSNSDDDLVATIVRRCSGGMAAPGLDLNLDLGMGVGIATTAGAVCSSPAVAVPPVLLDLGISGLAGTANGGLATGTVHHDVGGTEEVVSGPWLAGMRQDAGSPVTAIEVLGNVSSNSSDSSSSNSSERASVDGCNVDDGRGSNDADWAPSASSSVGCDRSEN